MTKAAAVFMLCNWKKNIQPNKRDRDAERMNEIKKKKKNNFVDQSKPSVHNAGYIGNNITNIHCQNVYCME